jgi:hypothetical protein
MKEQYMSGFDTSQPIADEKSLKDGGVADVAGKPKSSARDTESADSDELGDATPGPR